MDKFFLEILNMSITSTYVILFVILIRFFLKKAPKIYSYSLWSVVLLRLIIPFSFESIFSLIRINPKSIPTGIIYTQTPQISSGIGLIDNIVNNTLPAATTTASVNPIQIWIGIGQLIWLVGIIILILYSIITTIKLSKRLKNSTHVSGNIYKADHITTPFVFGLIKPRIYLPINLSENEKSYIIKHEQTHIERYDHIIKFIGFILLSIHWFNPLVWLAFILMSKDMELSCDEKVIKELGNEIKKDYSNSLLSLSLGKKIISGSPLAFGENNTKGRIKNILNYKKPKSWVTLIAIVLVIIVAVGLLSNPLKSEDLNKIDKTKVVAVRKQISPNGDIEELDNEIGFKLIDDINNSKWTYLAKEDWPYGKDIIGNITIILARYKSVDNNQYILTIYNSKDKEYNLTLLNVLDDDIKVWSLPEDLSEKVLDVLSLPDKIIVSDEENKNYNIISEYMKERSIATFSPYYELLDFQISNYNELEVDGNVEATFFYKIIEKNYDRDPDTVQYIKEAKESGNENYQQMYDEYLAPREMNFDFKVVIHKDNSITLYSNVDPKGIQWEETEMSDFIISN